MFESGGHKRVSWNAKTASSSFETKAAKCKDKLKELGPEVWVRALGSVQDARAGSIALPTGSGPSPSAPASTPSLSFPE